MSKKSVTEYLIRAVLDHGFRQKALSESDQAFEGFDLSPEEKEILRGGDSRLLTSLGGSVAQFECTEASSASDTAAGSDAPVPAGLATVELLLCLTPQVSDNADSGAQVGYTASLEPWTGTASSRDAETNDGNEAKSALPEITWLIRITPTVVSSGSEGLEVGYSASIRPVDVTTGAWHKQVPASLPCRLETNWGHHVESRAAKRAAQAVLTCEPDRRYERLLELIDALQNGDGHD